MSYPTVKINTRGTKRQKAGHPWVFANEIDGGPGSLTAGEIVDVQSPTGGFLCRGFADPKALIAIRVLSRNKREDVEHPAFFMGLIRRAVAHRQAVKPTEHSLRLISGEADGLPGLTVDRVADVLLISITSAGLFQRRDALKNALIQVIEPKGAVLLKTAFTDRKTWFGDVPESVMITENAVQFEVPVNTGHLVDHYFDQADNRAFAASLCKDGSFLDVYSHDGAWAMHALVAGASKAVIVDKTEDTCAVAYTNAEHNGVQDKLTVICDEGKKTLQHLLTLGERFHVVVLDPPPFAKARKAVVSAIKGYTEINTLAASLVAPGGFLFTSCRSQYIDDDSFQDLVAVAGSKADRKLTIVRRGGQSPDHPIVPAIPETRYLKHLALRVTTI